MKISMCVGNAYGNAHAESLGLILVDALIRQLKGELKLGIGKGAKFALTFPKD